MFPRVDQIISRLSDYRWWEIAVEILILWVILFVVYRFVRGTRAAGALKGLLFLLIVATLVIRVVARDTFPRLEVLYDKFLGIAAIALIVTFQPELRRLLIRLGEAPFFRPSDPELPKMVDAIIEACVFASKSRFGAIIAIERSVGLRELAEGGRQLDANVSAPLLNTIFWPNTPLHDMGVVIRGRRIVAAGVQFPLAHPAEMPDPHLGTRHRAAVGLARVTDALVIVVSEETGDITLAEGRRLRRKLSAEELRAVLLEELQHRSASADEQPPESAAESSQENAA